MWATLKALQSHSKLAFIFAYCLYNESLKSWGIIRGNCGKRIRSAIPMGELILLYKNLPINNHMSCIDFTLCET